MDIKSPAPKSPFNIHKKGQVDPEKAWEKAKEFEVMFMNDFLQHMFSGFEEGMFGGGKTETMLRSFFTEKIAQSMPQGFGIAEQVYTILLKGQEEKHDKS